MFESLLLCKNYDFRYNFQAYTIDEVGVHSAHTGMSYIELVTVKHIGGIKE